MTTWRPVLEDEPAEDPKDPRQDFRLDKETAWRKEQFEALGFDPIVAEVLALRKSDYRVAEKLLEKTSHDLVARIL